MDNTNSQNFVRVTFTYHEGRNGVRVVDMYYRSIKSAWNNNVPAISQLLCSETIEDTAEAVAGWYNTTKPYGDPLILPIWVDGKLRVTATFTMETFTD